MAFRIQNQHDRIRKGKKTQGEFQSTGLAKLSQGQIP